MEWARKLRLKSRQIKHRAGERCTRQVARQACRNNTVGVGEIGVCKRQRSRLFIRQRSRWVDQIDARCLRRGGQIAALRALAADKSDRLRPGRYDRHVIGAGDRYRELEFGDQIARQVIVIDKRVVGQRQRLALGEEVEGTVGDAVGPGCRAEVAVTGRGDHGEFGFHRRDVRELLGAQRRRDIGVRGVLVGERIELGRYRRRIANIDVDETDLARRRIGRRTVGHGGKFGDLETGNGLAAGIEDDGSRRLIDVHIGDRQHNWI